MVKSVGRDNTTVCTVSVKSLDTYSYLIITIISHILDQNYETTCILPYVNNEVTNIML